MGGNFLGGNFLLGNFPGGNFLDTTFTKEILDERLRFLFSGSDSMLIEIF